MSLFERIKYKRYDLQEVKKKMGGGSNTEGSGGGPRTRTRTNPLETIFGDNKNKKKKKFSNTSSSNTGSSTSAPEYTKKINQANKNRPEFKGDAAERAKTFKKSFGTPSGADPFTGKPTYRRSTVSGKLGPDIDLPKGRGGGIPTDKAYEKQAKRLGDRERAKKAYLDPKTNKASDEGIKRYIKKARQMRSGSNVPVDNRSVETIFKSAKDEYAKKINQKYGGRVPRLAPYKYKTPDYNRILNFVKTPTGGQTYKPATSIPKNVISAMPKKSKTFGKSAMKFLTKLGPKGKAAAALVGLGVGAYALTRDKTKKTPTPLGGGTSKTSPKSSSVGIKLGVRK